MKRLTWPLLYAIKAIRCKYLLALYISCTAVVSGQGLLIKPGAYVIVNDGNVTLKGNWVNDGTVTNNGGTINYTGTTQSVEGSTSTEFNNITIASGSTTTVNSGQTLKGILLCNGTMNANGNFTLLSTTTQTALIDGSGTGSVLGNLTMQRYLASGFGYKYFSSPFQSATVNEFATEINLSASFPTFYRYNEDRTSAGWVNYVATSGKLSRMQGYAANFGPLNPPVTASVAGVVNNGNIDTTLYNNNRTYTLGFNLVGNPYPSPIDWDAASGWTKTNIDNAIYFFNAGTTNQYTGIYSSYINGVSSDGGIANDTIAAMQGFFVHVTNGTYPVTGTLGFSNSVRINDLVPVFKSKEAIVRPRIRLIACFSENNAASDPSVIYFDDMASVSFDKDYDALKLMNTDDEFPNLYALSNDNARLSINAIPFPNDSIVKVPLGIRTNQDGWINIGLKEVVEFPLTTKIYLNDAKTGINQNLQINSEYKVFLLAGTYEKRFSLKFSLNELINQNPDDSEFNVIHLNGKLYTYVTLEPGQKGSLVISNVIGQVIWEHNIYNNGNNEIDLQLKTGIYIVSFFAGNDVHSKKLFIQE